MEWLREVEALLPSSDEEDLGDVSEACGSGAPPEPTLDITGVCCSDVDAGEQLPLPANVAMGASELSVTEDPRAAARTARRVFRSVNLSVLVGGRALGKVRARVICDVIKRHGGRAAVAGRGLLIDGITHVMADCGDGDAEILRQWRRVTGRTELPQGALVVPPEWLSVCMAEGDVATAAPAPPSRAPPRIAPVQHALGGPRPVGRTRMELSPTAAEAPPADIAPPRRGPSAREHATPCVQSQVPKNGTAGSFPWGCVPTAADTERDAAVFGRGNPSQRLLSGDRQESEGVGASTNSRTPCTWGPAVPPPSAPTRNPRGPKVVVEDLGWLEDVRKPPAESSALPPAGPVAPIDSTLLKAGFIAAFFGDNCTSHGAAGRAATLNANADDPAMSFATAAEKALPSENRTPLFLDEASLAGDPTTVAPVSGPRLERLHSDAADIAASSFFASARVQLRASGRCERDIRVQRAALKESAASLATSAPEHPLAPIADEAVDELAAFFATSRVRHAEDSSPQRALGAVPMPDGDPPVVATAWERAPIKHPHAVDDTDTLQITVPGVALTKNAEYFACVKGRSGVAAEDAMRGPGPNDALVSELERLRQIYASTGDHWRKYAYSRAVAVVKRWRTKITSREDIEHAPGIGGKMADKIHEILETGGCEKRRLLEASEEVTVARAFGKIWGVGPATISRLYRMGIRSLETLQARRSEVLNHSQQVGLRYYAELQERIPRREVAEAERYVTAAAEAVRPSLKLQVCGSYRRGKETCGDIDVLVCHPATEEPRDLRHALNAITAILTRQGFLTDQLVGRHTETHRVSDSHASYMGICRLPPCGDPVACPFTHIHDIALGDAATVEEAASAHVHRRIDIKVYDERHYAFAVLYFTGSDYFNRSMRLYSQKRGMSLSDKNLCPVVRVSKEKVHEGDPVPCSTEEEIFAALGLEYKLPAERDV